MEHIILIGKPGSGKGSIAKHLTMYCHLSTGDVFRQHVKDRTQLGLEITEVMSSGELVNDELTCAVVEDFIRRHMNQIICFDGFPRNEAQLKWLMYYLHDMNEDSIMIHVEAKDSLIIDRILKRGKIDSRPEDMNEAIIQKRLDDYALLTQDVVEQFKYIDPSNYYQVDGSVDFANCAEETLDIILDRL